MKVLKIGVFAMALGFFAASCTNSTTNTDENAATDTEQLDQATPSEESMTPADTDTSATEVPADTSATAE